MTETIEPKKKRSISNLRYSLSILAIYGVVAGLYIIRQEALLGYFPLPYVVLHLIGFFFLFLVSVFVLVVFIPTVYIQRRRSWLMLILNVVCAFLIYVGIVFIIFDQDENIPQYIKEYEHITLNGYTYYALSITDIFVYEQYIVYRCNKLHLICQRIFDPYRRRIESFVEPVDSPIYNIGFFIEDKQLFLQMDAMRFLVPTGE
jgi:O-antigen ligase